MAGSIPRSRARTAIASLAAATLVAGCTEFFTGTAVGPGNVPGQVAQPPQDTFHLVVRNATLSDVDVEYEGHSAGSGTGMGGGATACTRQIFGAPLGETWEVTVAGQHAVGTIDRPELSARNVHEITVELDILADGVHVGIVRPGRPVGPDSAPIAPCPSTTASPTTSG